MRVISGIYKGKMLKSPTSTGVRPTGDKVKQAIFTKLQFDIQNKRVLDLFSGSGALGIEALSRGAKEVIFADKESSSVYLTKQNLSIIGSNAKVYKADYKTALNNIKGELDIILIDPPYASGVYEDCLKIIFDNKLLSKDGIIVCERDGTKPINSDLFSLVDDKRYGTVNVSYYQYKEKNE